MAVGTTADGRLLLASGSWRWSVRGSWRRSVRVWDPLTGARVGKRLTGHTGTVASVAFGTTGDGRLLLATGSRDRSVRVWDPLTGAPVGQPLTGHTATVASVAFGTTGDGRLLLATGSQDRSVRVWDPASSRPILILRRRFGVRSVAISGPFLAIGDHEGVSVIEPWPERN